MAMIPAKPRTTTRPAAARTGARLKPVARLAPDKAAPAAPKGLADTTVVAPGPSAELADAMLDAMDEGVAVFDLDARPIYCNSGQRRSTIAKAARTRAHSDSTRASRVVESATVGDAG